MMLNYILLIMHSSTEPANNAMLSLFDISRSLFLRQPAGRRSLHRDCGGSTTNVTNYAILDTNGVDYTYFLLLFFSYDLLSFLFFFLFLFFQVVQAWMFNKPVNCSPWIPPGNSFYTQNILKLQNVTSIRKNFNHCLMNRDGSPRYTYESLQGKHYALNLSSL